MQVILSQDPARAGAEPSSAPTRPWSFELCWAFADPLVVTLLGDLHRLRRDLALRRVVSQYLGARNRVAGCGR